MASFKLGTTVPLLGFGIIFLAIEAKPRSSQPGPQHLGDLHDLWPHARNDTESDPQA